MITQIRFQITIIASDQPSKPQNSFPFLTIRLSAPHLHALNPSIPDVCSLHASLSQDLSFSSTVHSTLLQVQSVVGEWACSLLCLGPSRWSGLTSSGKAVQCRQLSSLKLYTFFCLLYASAGHKLTHARWTHRTLSRGRR